MQSFPTTKKPTSRNVTAIAAKTQMNEKAGTKRVLMWDITPRSADFLLNLSNFLLMVGAAAVLIGTIGSVKMASVREEFSNERISLNEAATAKAIAESDVAKAEAAKAQLALEKFKQPRLLGEGGVSLLAATLLRFEGTRFDGSSSAGDAEAIIFLSHIAAALEAAKWQWVPWGEDGGPFQMVSKIADKPAVGQIGFFGVLLLVSPDDVAKLVAPATALVDELTKRGFEAKLDIGTNVSASTKNAIHVIVGRKR